MKPDRGPKTRVLVLVVALASPASLARAADAQDASHGRIDGDLAVAVGAGATLGPRAPRATADLRFRYLQTAGIFGTYEDGPLLGDAEPKRAFATGLELRPLFIARWLQGWESGKPYLDLTLDSIALELGAVFMQPEGARLGSKPGLQAGLGFEVPLFPKATGFFVGFHGGARWSDASLGGSPVSTAADRSLYLSMTISWQQIFGAHVVDLGDRRQR